MRLVHRQSSMHQLSRREPWSCMLAIDSPAPGEGLHHLLDLDAINRAATKAGFRFCNFGTGFYLEPPYDRRPRKRHAAEQMLEQMSRIVLENAGRHRDGPLAFVDQLESGRWKDPTADQLAVRITWMGGDMYAWNVGVDGWRGEPSHVIRFDDARRALSRAGFEPVWGNFSALIVKHRHGLQLESAALQLAGLTEPFLRVRRGALPPVIYLGERGRTGRR
jgi:hypothetical protein